jgi:hypothetical protein
MFVQYSTALTCPAEIRLIPCIRWVYSSMPGILPISFRVVSFEILKTAPPFGSKSSE